MALEDGQFIADLSTTDPTNGDKQHQLDDQVRALKRAIRQTFAGGDFSSAADGLTQALLNGFDARLTALEALSDPGASIQLPYINYFSDTTTGSKSLTGFGFQPSVVLMFARGLSGFSFGAATSSWSTGRCLHISSTGAVDRSEYQTGKIARIEDGNNTVESQATFTSFDADGITYNVNNVTTVLTGLVVAFK